MVTDSAWLVEPFIQIMGVERLESCLLDWNKALYKFHAGVIFRHYIFIGTKIKKNMKNYYQPDTNTYPWFCFSSLY